MLVCVSDSMSTVSMSAGQPAIVVMRLRAGTPASSPRAALIRFGKLDSGDPVSSTSTQKNKSREKRIAAHCITWQQKRIGRSVACCVSLDPGGRVLHYLPPALAPAHGRHRFCCSAGGRRSLLRARQPRRDSRTLSSLIRGRHIFPSKASTRPLAATTMASRPGAPGSSGGAWW